MRKAMVWLAALFFIVGLAPAEWRYNPYTGKLDYYQVGGAATNIGGLADVLLTKVATGDILYRDAAAKWVNRPLGAGGAYVRSNGTLPVYSTIQAGDRRMDQVRPASGGQDGDGPARGSEEEVARRLRWALYR